MQKTYTNKQLKFLRSAYARMPIRDLTPAFNAKFGTKKTKVQIKSTLQRFKIRCGRKGSERMVPYRSSFSPNQEKFLRDGYTGRSIAELTAIFNDRFGKNRTKQQMRTAVHNRRLISGRDGRFKKGCRSWNKGVKGYIGANRTSFKKGHKPASWKPLGAERIDSRDGLILVKVKERDPYTGFPTRYKAKHVHLWEKMHGPVPKGFVVAFKDSNNRNFKPENLILISRAELLTLNRHGYKEMPADLKPSVLILSKLKAKTFALLRTKEGKIKNP
jgi:hypothetical protein